MDNAINRKEGRKKLMELHIRRVTTPDKAPKVVTYNWVCSNNLVFNDVVQAKEYAKKWSIFLTNKMQMSITCQAKYKHKQGYKTLTHKHEYNAALAN